MYTNWIYSDDEQLKKVIAESIELQSKKEDMSGLVCTIIILYAIEKF